MSGILLDIISSSSSYPNMLSGGTDIIKDILPGSISIYNIYIHPHIDMLINFAFVALAFSIVFFLVEKHVFK